jgi:hypothetical protein
VLTAAIFDDFVNQILEIAKRAASGLEAAGIPYRVVGGFAVFLHIDPVDPMAARTTPDVDFAIRRGDLNAVRTALESSGFQADGDTFRDTTSGRKRSAVHLVFLGEKVRPDYLESVPACEPTRTKEGVLIAPVADLVHMKLTSFRLKDQVHIQDLDGVGLITPEIEKTLSAPLLARLAEVRAKE